MASSRKRSMDLNRLYELLNKLELKIGGKRILRECHAKMGWPRRGIYFFFENGERRQNGLEPRVVRVGTHAVSAKAKTTLWSRLKAHKGGDGGRHPGGGNHRGSIFRLHVGNAIINRDGLSFGSWGKRSSGGADLRVKEHPLEIQVSKTIRSMPFLWLQADDEPGATSIRKYIERNSIALLSNFERTPIDPSSPGWLGQYCTNERVRKSGLWNVDHVDEEYDPAFLDVLLHLLGKMNFLQDQEGVKSIELWEKCAPYFTSCSTDESRLAGCVEGAMNMKVLFDKNGDPCAPSDVMRSIENFGHRYNQVVNQIIENSDRSLDKDIFSENIATLLPNFKMTRKGPFEGIGIVEGILQDPKGIIGRCWKEVGKSAMALKTLLTQQNKGQVRVLVEIALPLQEEVAGKLWVMFKKILPLCMGKYTYGLVGASKILFAILPEVALPIDNSQWLNVFKTIDYGDIIMAMAIEIAEWEKRSGRLLDDCCRYERFTLPAIYNVMAMKARPAHR